MHYNQFTINYIEAIKSNLSIEVNNKGKALFFPDRVEDVNLINLKNKLTSIWDESNTAIDIVKEKRDSSVQSGLFGLVNDLGVALKVGYLISDRVVILDYLYERILLKKEPNKINRDHLGAIANGLVEILPLAKQGRVVVIPTPFKWNKSTKDIINEVSSNTLLTPELVSMLNMLSITKICHLHPYTIAESEKNYQDILSKQIDSVSVLGKDTAQYAYEGILGALISEKLLIETEFNFALNIPIDKYNQVISSNKEFYRQYLSQVTSGGSLCASNNIEILEKGLLEASKNENVVALNIVAKGVSVVGGLGAGVVAIVAATTVVSAPLLITGAALGLSGSLAALLNQDVNKSDAIISVFKQLRIN